MNNRANAEYEVTKWLGEGDVVLRNSSFQRLVELVLAAQASARMEEIENAAKWCDGLASLYPCDLGFDIGYTMCARRAATDIRNKAWKENE